MSALDEPTRKLLATIARSAIAADLFGESDRVMDDSLPDLPGSGIFVTLRKAGRLRGCIGTFTPHGSLVDTVRAMAASAAHDPRFLQMPISAAEMKDLSIEISVLSPLTPIADPLMLQLGIHGIYIRRGPLSGCFLPEVASERGWDAATFLSYCCEQKAGLEPDAWQKPDTEVFVFTVDKFTDE